MNKNVYDNLIERYKERRKKLQNTKPIELKPLFDVYYSEGFKSVIKKFSYSKSQQNLIQQFKTYLPKEFYEMKNKHKYKISKRK